MARPRTNPTTIDKICPTCKTTFTLPYRKKRQIFCGRTCAVNNPMVIQRMITSQQDTYNQRYNGKHPMKLDSTKEKLNNTMLQKYGVKWFPKHKNYNEKVKNTKKIKYGNENYNNREKAKHTCIEKYGIDNFTKTPEYIKIYQESCLEKYGVNHYSKSNEFVKSHKNNMFNKFLNSDRFSNFQPMFDMNNYNGMTHGVVKYPFKCIRCNNISNHDITNGKPIFCNTCDETNISNFQKGIFNYIKEIIGNTDPIEQNNRTIIYPKELDIIIPSKKLAIECNGISWHSEVLGNKNKVYHLNKTKQCLSKEIFLIQIFENEWRDNQEIVKSILANVLKKCNNKIPGRKCIIKEIDKNICKKFLDENHLQGNDHSTYKYGLFYNNELVSVMTFCKSRFDSKIEYEMSRFCNKINTIVHGGASKLFQHFIKTKNPISIVSYSDRRYFDGELYKNLDFEFVQNTPPNYFYIMDNYQKIQHRMNWQKHKLKNRLPIFDPLLSEWENMKNNGFDRIWDCGHSKWIFKNTTS